jgi:hypothetical protein
MPAVLAHDRAATHGWRPVQSRLVFKKALAADVRAEHPTHFTRDPQRREAATSSPAGHGVLQVDHRAWLEVAIAHVLLARGDQQQRPALELGARLRPERLQGPGHFCGSVGIGEVQALLAVVQPTAKKCQQHPQPLGRAAIDRTDVYARRGVSQLVLEDLGPQGNISPLGIEQLGH